MLIFTAKRGHLCTVYILNCSEHDTRIPKHDTRIPKRDTRIPKRDTSTNTGTKKWFKIQHSNTNIQIIVQTVIPGHKNPGGFKAQHRNI